MNPETKPRKEVKKKDNTARNLFYFVLATAAVGALIYFTIKEGKRIKKENELLDYEVW
ncbi:MAG: hypothetical protein J5I50_08915 [Chitinophagaceae bacterium]|nr:hypothetical protein [Chitinophagaceae bacterium]